MTSRRPNILWYCTDQQRFDTIGALGNPHVRTPNIDRLVASGTAFTRAYAQSPICTPSRASFLTGRYPSTTHVHRNGAARFPQNEVLVTKLLAEAGYDCGLIGKLHLASAASGTEERTDDGYRVFEYSHHPMPGPGSDGNAYHSWLREEKGVLPEDLYRAERRALYDGFPAEYHQTTWCTEMALRFIDEDREGPWMLSINPFDPHPPFDPPADILGRYDPDTLPPPLFRPGDVERIAKFSDVSQQTSVPFDTTQRVEGDAAKGILEEGARQGTHPPRLFDGRVIKAAYYAMIELLDAQFGRIVDHLEATGQLENTLIVFHSDHGEMLGDHGMLYKGCRFFEGLVHVPLILAWPSRILKGMRRDALVELVDLAPTLLEAAGMEVPDFMQGRSLMTLATNRDAPDRHKDAVLCEFNDALATARVNMPSHATMVFDGRVKSIVYHGLGFGEIYDLDKDPGEFDDLWENLEETRELAAILHRHLDAVMGASWVGIGRSGLY